jgi:hypothetical protein
MLDWRRIEGVPFEEDVELFVTDRCGSYYRRAGDRCLGGGRYGGDDASALGDRG